MRNHLEADDFERLRDAGLLRAVVPEVMGGLWRSVAETTPRLCALFRALGRADSSVALVSARHPAVVGFWLAPEIADAAWIEQRTAVAESACEADSGGRSPQSPAAAATSPVPGRCASSTARRRVWHGTDRSPPSPWLPHRWWPTCSRPSCWACSMRPWRPREPSSRRRRRSGGPTSSWSGRERRWTTGSRCRPSRAPSAPCRPATRPMPPRDASRQAECRRVGRGDPRSTGASSRRRHVLTSVALQRMVRGRARPRLLATALGTRVRRAVRHLVDDGRSVNLGLPSCRHNEGPCCSTRAPRRRQPHHLPLWLG